MALHPLYINDSRYAEYKEKLTEEQRKIVNKAGQQAWYEELDRQLNK